MSLGGSPAESTGCSMDWIEIEQLEVDCIIGINPHERVREQRVMVDLELGVELRRAGRSGDLGDTCNYAAVASEVAALLGFRRYHLMETAAEELAAMLFAVHPEVKNANLRLVKPGALVGKARGAAVRVGRARGAFECRDELLGNAKLRTWLETSGATLHTIELESDHRLEPPLHWASRRTESWLISGTTRVEGRAYAASGELERVEWGAPLVADSNAMLFVCVSAE